MPDNKYWYTVETPNPKSSDVAVSPVVVNLNLCNPLLYLFLVFSFCM